MLSDATAIHAEMQDLRRAIHAEPEIGNDLPKTQERVLDALSGLPLEISTGAGLSSVTAVLRGGAGGGHAAVLLRADMDALPLSEQADIPWRSRIDGAMHACGHDLHTSMLVGAAHVLASRRDQLAGDVVFMFQPGEEGWHGAQMMLDEGVLGASGRRVDAAFGMHVFSGGHPTGQVLTREGAMMAAVDALDVTVLGVGGHGSTPSRAKDPVTAVSEMVTALQTMITRQFDVFDPVVVTVGALHAGTARNIIPDTAEFAATLRTFSVEARERAFAAIPKVLKGIAAAHGVDVDIRHGEGYPVTFNDHDETAFAAHVTDRLFAGRRTALAHPFSASEDFSLVLAQVPGTFIGLSAAPVGQEPETAPFNHSPFARFDDSVLPDGAALYAELALQRLATGSAATDAPPATAAVATP